MSLKGVNCSSLKKVNITPTWTYWEGFPSWRDKAVNRVRSNLRTWSKFLWQNFEPVFLSQNFLSRWKQIQAPKTGLAISKLVSLLPQKVHALLSAAKDQDYRTKVGSCLISENSWGQRLFQVSKKGQESRVRKKPGRPSPAAFVLAKSFWTERCHFQRQSWSPFGIETDWGLDE